MSGPAPGRPERVDLEGLAALVPSGSTVAFGGCIAANRPMGAVRQMIRGGVEDLDIYSVLGGIEIELLIRAGAVRKVFLSHVSLGVFGVAPHFRRAVASKEIERVDVSGSLLLAALDGGARRAPFIPMYGDPTAPYLAETPGFAVTSSCPFTGEEVLLVRSINPDVVVIHAEAVDADGNAILATNIFSDLVLAMAGKRTIVTYERRASGRVHGERLLPRVFIDAVCHAPSGAFPTAFSPSYHLAIDWFEAYLGGDGVESISDIRDGGERDYLRRHGVL